MKKLIYFIILLPFFSFSQKIAKFGELKKGKYNVYITQNKDTLQEGDKLIIGSPMAADAFTYITQNNLPVHPRLSGKEVEVHHIKVWGANKDDASAYVAFKGYGLAPVYIDYENAIFHGEVINPNAALTKEDAMAQLEEAKKMLDLELITQEEYDQKKKKLKKYIIQD